MNYDEARALAIEAVMHQYACQDPAELTETILAVASIAPQRICEIGVMDGGTLWCWKQAGAEHRYAITMPVNNPAWVRPHGAALLFGDSHDPASRAWLVQQMRGGKWSCIKDHRTEPCGICDGCQWALAEAVATAPLDVLFIDGDHSAEGCRADWHDYAPLVRPGGLVIFHDIEYMPPVGEFWRELKAAAPAGREFREIYAAEGALERAGVGIITMEGE